MGTIRAHFQLVGKWAIMVQLVTRDKEGLMESEHVLGLLRVYG